MDSSYIKEAVVRVNRIIATEDMNFSTNESRSAGTGLLLHLSKHFEDAPITATAMIQYLTDRGYKVSNLKGDAYRGFMVNFGPKISQFSPQQIEQLRKISKKLMTN